MPAPLFTKLVAPLIAPVIRLPVLEELIVKVETFDTDPPIVAAPLPELMVRAAGAPEPAIPTTFPAMLTALFVVLRLMFEPARVRLAP